MKKNFLILCLIAVSSLAYSQVGINTTNPQGSFHVDGAKDNPATGTPISAQQANDFTVTPIGNVGIGTTNPLAKLHVQGNAIITDTPFVTNSENTNSLVVTSNGSIKKLNNLNAYTNLIVAAGATSSKLNIPAQFNSSYDVSVTTGNGCGYSIVSKFLLTGSTFNNTWSLKHVQSVVGNNTATDYTAVQNSKSNISMTVTTSGCQDGGNGAQFNYTIDVNSSGQISIQNNGNISKTYALALSQI